MPNCRKINQAILEKSLGLITAGGVFFDVRAYENGFSARFSHAPGDPSRRTYRSQSDWLNQLALAHRLAVPIARDWLDLPSDHGFAISSMQLAIGPKPAKRGHALAMRLVVERNQRGLPVAIQARLWSRQGGALARVEIRFQLVPAALVGFIRRGRDFSDFASSSIDQPRPGLVPDGPRGVIFYPGESDRLVDGERVDHVPALVLIDRSIDAFAGLSGLGSLGAINASFTRYADPRRPISIELDAKMRLHLQQDGEEIARIHVVMGRNGEGLDAAR